MRFERRRGGPCSSRLDGVGVRALGGDSHGLDTALVHERHEERAALLLLQQEGGGARKSGLDCGGAQGQGAVASLRKNQCRQAQHDLR